MVEIGSFIKLQRTKQGMTLEDLSQGIVSLSYLSKIENLKTEASSEIIQMLCTRLGIQIDNSMENEIKEKSKEWYSMLFEVNDKEEIVRTYEELQALLDRNLFDDLMLFEIHKVRYHLVLGEYEKALEKINELNKVSSTFDMEQNYYWFKFRGNYNSVIGDNFKQAMTMYKHAEEKLQQLQLGELEVADLQYVIAITHSKLRNTLESIEYANKALGVFMKQYNFMRCAQCHIILGISYRRIRMHDKAIKNYNLAKHLGELNKDKQIIQLTNQNLGYLYSTTGKTEEAIKYYTDVVDDEEVHLNERMAAITSLIKEYYNISNIEKTKEMIVRALELIDLAKDNINYKLYDYMIHTYSHAINDEHEQFKSLVTDKFIPYLKKHKDYSNLVVYSNMLGSHFEKLGRYKESVKYYKLANLTYEELISL
ncbi:tetratricopeptide (TPR) repeat protein [Virgibacillus halotolerans]|uniref:helix-turn-helix domain-containing protein n=1 Tax=Virgibacillus halotolerans TaxID=1071053 RepID=UPI00195F4A8A|nr:helix-turn-helix transcriptional regulator [Virgibacillus halotolerans]MBM7601117.1 tetratricopeptide (TPR) repeat protein [Virgibacillus halotolerans]